MLGVNSSQWLQILIYTAFCFVLAFVGRGLPFDGKFLIILCLGYAFGGKGFAYLTPLEPFYVGEIALSLLMLGLLFRLRTPGSFIPTTLHLLIYIFCLYTVIRLSYEILEYGLMSIRDSSVCYYGLYFVGTFAILSNRRFYFVFQKSIFWVMLFGFIGLIGYNLNLSDKLGDINIWFQKIYLPHPDINLPLTIAFGVTIFVRFISTKKISYLPVLIVSVVFIMMDKTAGIFCTLLLCALLGFVARRVEFILVGGGFAILSLIGLVVLNQLSSLGKLPDFLSKNDHIITLSTAFSGDISQKNTTDWRMEWWRVIYEDTMNDNPIMGVGYGGDISSSFLNQYYGYDRIADDIKHARYPHNIMFTIFGRLGLSGLVIFLPIFLWIFVFCCKFARRYLSSNNYKYEHLSAFCVVVSGLGNSLIQATYEIPYAAIIHWTLLGYLVFEYYRPGFHNRNVNSKIDDQ